MMLVKRIIIYDKDKKSIRTYKPFAFERYNDFRRRVMSDLANHGIKEYYSELEFYD